MKTVGIIGGGISGLVTAKTLKEHGFTPIIFEKESEVGGVWATSRHYPGMTTQNTKDSYAFSDYPMPEDYPEWPNGPQMQAYLDGYATHFGIKSAIQFNMMVENVHQNKDDSWTIKAIQTTGQMQQTIFQHVDKLVICNGIFSEPFMPDYAGKEEFIAGGGHICHSSQFKNIESVKDKKVGVVGFAKSACDVTVAVSEVAATTNIIYRRAFWKIPKKFFGKLNYKYVLINRLGESLFSYYKNYGIEKFLHGSGKFLLNSIWTMMAWALKKQLKLDKNGLLPEMHVSELGNSRLSLTTNGFYEKVTDGAITAKKAEITKLCKGGATLNTGEFVELDHLICGTGWRQTISFMEEDVLQKIRDKKGVFRLYRNILPTSVKNLAFVGYNSSLCCQFTSEIAAHWTAQYFKQALHLPSKTMMDARLEDYLKWLYNRTTIAVPAYGTCLVPFTFHYADDLMRDMGLSPRRANPIIEWLTPFNPARYKGLTKELQQLSPVMKPTEKTEVEEALMPVLKKRRA